MAESIQGKKSYLRQVQQEQAQKKRELMAQQKDDMRSLRNFYADKTKEVDSETAAAVNHIKAESAEISRQNRADKMQEAADARQARQMEADRIRDEKTSAAVRSPASRADANGDVEQSSARTNADSKTLYNRKAQKSERPTTLQNYETKETDDFYRVQNRGSRVSESNQGYVIEAYAPEHEKDNLRVSIHRNKAVVSGQRKFGDEAQEGNKTMRTNNYQTFREEFKLDRPVSNKDITRERVGDYVRFTIPKLEAMDEDEV